MRFDKTLLLVNPHAGNNQLNQELDRILPRLRKGMGSIHVVQTNRPGDGARAIAEQASSVDLVIAAGGDGTVYECINALSQLEQRPVFGILPGGTCNDFSRTLRIPQAHDQAAETLLEGRVEAIDVGKHDNHYFLNFWGIGLITQVSDQIQSEIKKQFGRIAYYLSALKTFQEQQPFYVEVKVDRVHYKGEAVMVLVGNGSHVGGVEAYFPQSQVNDGLLDVLIFKKLSLPTVTSLTYSLFTEKKPEAEDLLSFQTRVVEVRTEPRLKADCDGEKNSFIPTRLEVLPGYQPMLVGPDFHSPSK
ncbi:diacylglycerol/lipid kinase family protein [Laceyella putida]|uniref:Diacylglycerol/lipid kinase family protein n=1 Tax=Laceyella putida TaxID=110101 RepID=A0ABW2RJX8_9BACL